MTDMPDEAVEAGLDVLQSRYQSSDEYIRNVLAAALPALTAAARAEVAASVYALAETDYKGRPFVWLHEVREAVSDDGVTAHNQQMRAEGWDECIVFVNARMGGVVATHDENPYRAEAAGDQHHQGDDK
jgi:hypothetical protein